MSLIFLSNINFSRHVPKSIYVKFDLKDKSFNESFLSTEYICKEVLSLLIIYPPNLFEFSYISGTCTLSSPFNFFKVSTRLSLKSIYLQVSFNSPPINVSKGHSFTHIFLRENGNSSSSLQDIKHLLSLSNKFSLI